MAINRTIYVRELREWKDNISVVDSVPFNLNHKYKNPNDIYERLMQYTKEWVESMFGYYTNENGELVEIPTEKAPLQEGEDPDLVYQNVKSEICNNWLESGGKDMTALSSDWFDVALKGAKKGNNPLPCIKPEVLQRADGETAYSDARSDVVSTFFPAYRALKESFGRRPWYQWIFNHRQYVAERDALKVMTNLIKSMTGYKEKQLDVELAKHCASITPKQVQDYVPEAAIYQRGEEVGAPEDELFRDVERLDQIDVGTERVYANLFENEKRIDTWDVSNEQSNNLQANEDVPAVNGNEEQRESQEDSKEQDQEVEEGEENDASLENYKPAMEKLAAIQTSEENVNELCSYFVGEIKNATVSEAAMVKSAKEHLLEPMLSEAKTYCTMYDAYSISSTVNPNEKIKLAQKAAKGMFEKAFNGLGFVGEKEIKKMVDGKEVVVDKVQVPAFGIRSLKDRIVAAQNIADVMLKLTTPVGFNKKEYKEYGKGYHLLENTEVVRSFLKTACEGKYSEKEIDKALHYARNEMGWTYRNEKLDTSYLYNVDYRPDPAKFKEEFEGLGKIQRMVRANTKGVALVDDKACAAINNANIKKIRFVEKILKGEVIDSFDGENFNKLCEALNAQSRELYPNYDPEKSRSVVSKAIADREEQKKQEKLKIDLKEPKAQVVPPVKQKPVEISGRKIEK